MTRQEILRMISRLRSNIAAMAFETRGTGVAGLAGSRPRICLGTVPLAKIESVRTRRSTGEARADCATRR